MIINKKTTQKFGYVLGIRNSYPYGGGLQIRRNRGMPELKVKSGEEWVKSARTLFTPRNADNHRGFGAFGEE